MSKQCTHRQALFCLCPAFQPLAAGPCRDAQDAARGRDGYDFFGNRIRVELSHGSRDPMRGGGGPPPPPQTFRGRGTGFRALVKGLPISCSWQDLKVGCGASVLWSGCPWVEGVLFSSSWQDLMANCALSPCLVCPWGEGLSISCSWQDRKAGCMCGLSPGCCGVAT